jgi:tRNA nucleotidyltransferase (CCA-adding enzyme)
MMARTILIRSERKASLVSSRIQEFLVKYNGARLRIGGDDLKAMGLKSGPIFKAILNRVLYKKINGKLRTRREELEYARRLICRTIAV